MSVLCTQIVALQPLTVNVSTTCVGFNECITENNIGSILMFLGVPVGGMIHELKGVEKRVGSTCSGGLRIAQK